MTSRLLGAFAALIALATVAMLLAIGFGGPGTPAPLASISDPFRNVDYSDLPDVRRLIARDGTALAYRVYEPASKPAKGIVVAVHGSSARSDTMHTLARALAKAGYAVYAPDVRGHGDSGVRGQIAYVGQLEDDLEDLARSLPAGVRHTLLGFSSGGGFALRFAADARRALFDDYVLLAPFLGPDSPTYRPDAGGWASVGIPRIVGLTLLNQLGVHALDDLPVIAFALRPEAKASLTPRYSHALGANFRPRRDYRAAIASADRPMEVLVGAQDELFEPKGYAPEFSRRAVPAKVTVVPGLGHIGLALEPAGHAAILLALERLASAPH